ncbi:hypothetical protein GQ53DRAFT_819183 [Thozetella sp. PMI_491]|nr:hypothetical protein GQ53DRAFT_819183 [Thozetella sp. PMI_491]
MNSQLQMDGPLKNRQALDGLSRRHSRITSRAPRSQQADDWPSTSVYLTKSFLLGIAVIFVFMIAAAEALDYFSARDFGIAQVAEQQHYLWTYGPTLCFTIVAAVWGQLEYRVKQSMPWMELRRGPLPADRTIDLNYLSPSSVISLWTSVKNHHFQVSLVILSSWLLKVLVVISTGLLSQEPQIIKTQSDFSILGKFDLNSTGLGGQDHPEITLWAIKQQNVSFPPGTNEEVVAESFVAPSSGIGDILTANLVVFNQDTNCELFNWTYDSTAGSISTDAFSTAKPFSNADFMPADLLNTVSLLCVVGRFATKEEPFPSLANNVSSKYLNGTLLLDTNCSSGQAGLSNDARIFTSAVVNLPQNVSTVSALVCNPEYSLTRRQVSSISNGQREGGILNVSSTVLETLDLGIPPPQLTKEVLDSSNAVTSQNMFTYINYTGPGRTFASFRDPLVLSDSFEETFRLLALLTVKQRKVIPANETVPGVVYHEASRLVVTKIPLRLVEALLGLLAVMALWLATYDMRGPPMNPASFLSLADTLARSKDFEQIISENHVGSDGLPADRDAQYFFATTPGAVRIVAHDQCQPTQRRSSTRLASTMSDWQPLPATRLYRLTAIALAACLIVIIEVLLVLGDRNGGLATVSDVGYTRFTWLILPSFLMSMTAIYHDVASSAIRTLHPFAQLRLGKPRNIDDMIEDTQGDIAVLALAKSLHRRHIGLAAVLATSVLGPALPIVASGLFTVQPVSRETQVNMEVSTWFDLRNSSKLSRAYTFSGSVGFEDSSIPDAFFDRAIQFENMSYPALTYEQYVFASFNDSMQGYDNATEIRTRLPAARGQMNCSLLTYSDENLPTPSDDFFLASIPAPFGCGPGVNSSSDGSTIYMEVANIALLGEPATYPAYFGYLSDGLMWSPPGPNNSINSYDSRDSYTVCNDGVQHLFAVTGSWKQNNTLGELEIFHCIPYVEGLQVDVLLSLPDMKVKSSTPPAEVENSVQPWRSKIPADNSVALPRFTNTLQVSTDSFFSALSVGYQGIPLSELIGRSKEDLMIPAMNRVYQQLVAQALHFTYRKPVSNIIDDQDVGGTANLISTGPTGWVSNSAELRLTQSAISTQILSALLLALILPCLNDTQPQVPCVLGQEPCHCQDVLFAPELQLCIKQQCNLADSLITINITSQVCDLPIVNRGDVVSVSGLTLGAIDIVFIAVRLATKPKKHIGWQDNVDDWVMIINGAFVITMAVVGFELDQHGYGRDIWTLSFDQTTAINKLLYCHELMWSLILTFTRVSILFFYRRVIPFEVMPKLKYFIDGSILWVILGGMAITLPLIFRCQPFEPQFYSFQNGPAGLNCIDMQKHAWATGAINFFSDIWLVLLPVPALMNLRLHLRKKIGVGLMFSFGGFVTFASIPRMVSLVQYVDTFNPTC